ncbi:hypothetical protein [Salidesulfovibrio brasiliensis]|uniref:hypothetical protein n=1 Tax=Salidesulfovibrio brasiliensis TaxID=221711 RepID=UPI001C444CB8|nr:hypothetical protein [Salidesulfovibrio brasiliensis]
MGIATGSLKNKGFTYMYVMNGTNSTILIRNCDTIAQDFLSDIAFTSGMLLKRATVRMMVYMFNSFAMNARTNPDTYVEATVNKIRFSFENMRRGSARPSFLTIAYIEVMQKRSCAMTNVALAGLPYVEGKVSACAGASVTAININTEIVLNGRAL